MNGDKIMVVSEFVKVKWNARNKKRYEKLGYTYTKMGDVFDVKVKHLSEGSIAKILVRCDYCGNEYPIMYQTYIAIHRKTVSKSDCCESITCVNKKIMESNEMKYGVKHHIRADNVQKKVKKTLNEKYGVINVFEIEHVKEKVKETNLKKYGTKSYTQTKEFKNRVKKTSLEKYGFENHMQHPMYRKMFKGKNSPVWKGGVKFHRVERATGEYKSWRKAVFARDKYRCQCCKAKQGEVEFTVELHAHHIVTWKESKELRYDTNNGITFCHDCHNKFHSIYGKKNNDLIQVKEFISNYWKTN
jgi:hypothetical protein